MTSCEEKCPSCVYIVEENSTEALFACQGLANNYPEGYKETDRVNYTELCDEERNQLEVGVIEEIQICSGFIGTVRARLECN